MNAQYQEDGKTRSFVVAVEADGFPPERVTLTTKNCPKSGKLISKDLWLSHVEHRDLAIYRLEKPDWLPPLGA